MTGAYWPSLRPTLVDYGRLLDGITLEGELLAQAATGARGDLPASGRPGVTTTDAVLHTGTAYRRALAWIREGQEPDAWRQPPESHDDPIAFHTEARRELVAELATHRPDEQCATWWNDDRSYGFWRRRMAHETAVHRADVQSAIGLDVAPVEADFAADGIDEALRLWFAHRLGQLRRPASSSGAVGFEIAGRSWLAILSTARNSARRVPAVDARAADALITGDPTKVYLWLWGRVPHQDIEITGDYDAGFQLWGLLRTNVVDHTLV